jgi:spermidine synthase
LLKSDKYRILQGIILKTINEMLTHIPLCTHAEPQNIITIDASSELLAELSKYKDINITKLTSDSAIAMLTNMDEKSSDIIINTTNNFVSDEIFWGIANRVLTTKGLAVCLASSPMSKADDAQSELKAIGSIFRIVMPYSFYGNDDKVSYAYMATKFYHPTADINLQRADLTDGHEYYNCDIAISAFTMPTSIRKRFLGLIKS